MQISASVDGLRIVAPRAVHIAALEKNRRANARTVVQGKAFDFRYHSSHRPIPLHVTHFSDARTFSARIYSGYDYIILFPADFFCRYDLRFFAFLCVFPYARVQRSSVPL